MAHVLNATLRLSQRTSTRKVSHVLSGSTRSLSSTSSPAVRGCAARNASFVTAFSTPRYTSPEEVEEPRRIRTRRYQGDSRADADRATGAWETEKPRRRAGQHHRVQAPSKTLFEDVRKVFEGCGTITAVNIHVAGNAVTPPNAFVTMSQEPYVLEGRQLREFLGDLSGAVDSAYFVRDKRKPNAWAPSGMIICRDTESATEIIAACHGRPGPDGRP
ncbi:hypothetical protein FA13DRAFT_1748473, partial [Coprinellus micaceus]